MRRAPHIRMTEREFRKKKRAEVRELEAAWNKVFIGCGYMPFESSRALGGVQKAIKVLKQQMRKDWPT